MITSYLDFPKYLTSGNSVQRYNNNDDDDGRPQEISCLWCAFDTYCISRKPSSFGVNDEFVVCWDNGIGDLTIGTLRTILIFGKDSFNSSTWNMRKQKQINNPTVVDIIFRQDLTLLMLPFLMDYSFFIQRYFS